MSNPKRRRKKKSGGETDESWLLPYSDMLTLLLALFIVLFAMSEVDVQKFQKLASIFETEFSSGNGMLDGGTGIVPDEAGNEGEGQEENDDQTEESAAEQEYNQLKEMQTDIDEYIDAKSLKDTLGTELTAEGLFITMRTDITFDSGSAAVRKQGKKIANEIAVLLESDPPHEIVINGHADDRPLKNDEYDSNWELSTMRAIQFMYLLMDDSNIEPRWFSARGYGEYRPIVENTSEHNRAINRRVEVLVQPNYDIEEEVTIDTDHNEENG